MPTDLQAILRMRKPKGRHVGAAMLLNLVNDFEHIGVPHEPLFSQEKLSRMTASFSSEYELRVYSNYADIVAGAEHLFDYIECCVQQAMHGFYRLSAILSELIVAKKVRAAAHTAFPQDQFNALLAGLRCAEDLESNPEERAFLSASYYSLILPSIRDMLAFDRFMEILAEATGVPELARVQSRSSYVLETVSLLNSAAQEAFFPHQALLRQRLFPLIDEALLSPERESCQTLLQSLKNLNQERCLLLKKLKPLMLSIRRGEGQYE